MSRSVAQELGEARLASLLQELAGEASSFRFEVAPNPCVGAAVVSGERVLARGFHQAWGGDHAEVHALAAAAKTGVPREQWDALVVTLEPCSTTGKTPPCVDAILAAGVRRVVVGELDPDPRHAGRGLELLRQAGVEVEHYPGTAPLAAHSPHFLRWTDPDRLRRPRPWTIAKWAQTRTGQLVPPSGVGDGRWIAGPDALREVQVLRGRVDAIVTGVGTILADDPRLTVRPPGDVSRAPWRIVLDSHLRTPPEATILRPPAPGTNGGAVHVLCVGGADRARFRALVDAGAVVHELHVATDDGVHLRDAQEWMWSQDLRRVLLEAGPRLLTHYLDSAFVDQLRVYTGTVNGGEGPSLADRLVRLRFRERLDREWGTDAVLEAFLWEGEPDRRGRIVGAP